MPPAARILRSVQALKYRRGKNLCVRRKQPKQQPLRAAASDGEEYLNICAVNCGHEMFGHGNRVSASERKRESGAAACRPPPARICTRPPPARICTGVDYFCKNDYNEYVVF